MQEVDYEKDMGNRVQVTGLLWLQSLAKADHTLHRKDDLGLSFYFDHDNLQDPRGQKDN